MNVLFDTNVVLDVLLDRKPFSVMSSALFAYVEYRKIRGFLCATTITTVYYLSAKTIGISQTNDEIRKLLQLFNIAPVDDFVLKQAIDRGFADFEDAVLHESAYCVGLDAIVTRNAADFKLSLISIYTPDELADILRVTFSNTHD